MGRFQSDDFGYTFAATTPETPAEEQASLIPPPATAATTTDASPATPSATTEGYQLYEEETATPGGEADATTAPGTTPAPATAPSTTAPTATSTTPEPETEPFIYQPSKPTPRSSHEGFVEDAAVANEMTTVSGVACLASVCCCLAIGLVVVGGILIAYEQTDNPQLLTGSILVVVATGTCLCGCCLFLVSALSDALPLDPSHEGGSVSPGDPHYKEIKVRFRKLNDRYEKINRKSAHYSTAESCLHHVRTNVVGDIKAVKDAAAQAVKKQKETDKKQQEALEQRVQQDLQSGLYSIKQIQQKYRPVTFLVVFEGDVMVSNLELLRKQVSLVVQLGQPGIDQCVVALTSPGGSVSQYGLAASQLVRIRQAGIHLVACVDTVAASGGYMMASVANVICAAPFAIVGSIGVVTQIPNVQRFLNKHDIDAYLMTAGKHKRTIDLIGDVTQEGKDKLQEELNDVHMAFQDHIGLARPQLQDKIQDLATGEHWLAVQAKPLGLVDEIRTSDEFLEQAAGKGHDIIEILEKRKKPSPWGSMATSLQQTTDRVKSLVVDSTRPVEQSPLPMAIV